MNFIYTANERVEGIQVLTAQSDKLVGYTEANIEKASKKLIKYFLEKDMKDECLIAEQMSDRVEIIAGLLNFITKISTELNQLGEMNLEDYIAIRSELGDKFDNRAMLTCEELPEEAAYFSEIDSTISEILTALSGEYMDRLCRLDAKEKSQRKNRDINQLNGIAGKAGLFPGTIRENDGIVFGCKINKNAPVRHPFAEIQKIFASYNDGMEYYNIGTLTLDVPKYSVFVELTEKF